MNSWSMWTSLPTPTPPPPKKKISIPQNDIGLTGFYKKVGHFQTCVMKGVSQGMKIYGNLE